MTPFVGSSLGYSSEIWGFGKYKVIEIIQLTFFKRILGLKVNTVYGELGRYPLYKSRYMRITKYWCKVSNSNNIIVKSVYTQGVIDCERGYNNWVASVKHILNSYGFGYAFYIPEQVNAKSFPIIFLNNELLIVIFNNGMYRLIIVQC